MAIATRVDAYRALGLPVGASMTEVKNAYKELSKKYHPDVVGQDNAAMFIQINEAYNFLVNNPATSSYRVLGGDEGAMMRYANQRSNREKQAREAFNAKRRKKEKEEALEKAAIEARKRREHEKAVKAAAEVEAERQAKAIQMAMMISKMLGDEK